MKIAKTAMKKGFTLVELMIVVAIIGILAVLAIYGVSRYITNAKTGEARNALGQISKSAVAAYEEERATSELVTPGSSAAGASHSVCAAATNKVPAAITGVENKKYQSSQKLGEDWGLGDRNTGWPCLKFALTEPQYFMYSYNATSAAVDNQKWTAGAESSFKGGGITLGFSIGGQTAGTGKDIQMTVSTQIKEVDGAATEPGNSLAPY